jgi:nickel/cobalt transporter (NiCoT) family protein
VNWLQNSGDTPGFRTRLLVVYGVVAVLTLGGWAWAGAVFHHNPALLGVALMIYALGLRHAVDADHIAAIDNVTRKLMQNGKRPVAVGFFFAMGHSTVVTIVAAFVATATTMLGRFQSLRAVGGAISVGISASFLLAIAVANIVVFVSIYRSYGRVRAGGTYVEEDLDLLLGRRGLLARVLRPILGFISESWQMFPLGFLFGLGFDTATEVAMFGVSAAEMSRGMSFLAILVFPILFAAGMALIDTTDGVVMLGAYEWAFVNPIRKLYYNMTITLVSVAAALLIGGIEGLGLLAAQFSLGGVFWNAIATLNSNFNDLGFAIIGLFLVAWAASYLIYRFKGLDELAYNQFRR